MFPETVTTDRLRLERLSSAVDPLEFYRYAGRPREPDVAEETRHVTWSPHSTPKESFDVLRQFDERWEDGEAATYAVFPREGEERAGEFAGDTGLSVEWEKRSGGLGIWLRKRFWGRGYSGERAAALLDLAFDRLDLELVSVGHTPDNENSRRAVERYVERFGGRREGRLRNWIVDDDGQVHDAVRYSVAKEEWREAVADDRPEVRYPRAPERPE